MSARDPEAAIGARQHCSLGDQLGLGLLNERVFIDAQEDRAEARQSGDEQQGGEEDGAQAKPWPETLEEILERPDQSPPPRQGPIR